VVKLIAISGSGRSGSTLLSLLLSQDARVFNLGQLRHLWRAYELDEPCSCGHTLQHCPRYAGIVANTAAMQAAGKAFFSDAANQPDWSSIESRTRLKERHGDFLLGLCAVLTQVAADTGATHLVDSSKAPEMALAFSLLPGFDLYLLNLVRDPRAVACSWYRKKRSVSALISNARDWKHRQRRLREWRAALPGRYLALRYEDLSTAPAESLRAIADWAELPLNQAMFVAANRVSLGWHRQHLYPPANERVLNEQKSDVKIAVAESWRNPRNTWIHFVARTLAGSDGREFYPD